MNIKNEVEDLVLRMLESETEIEILNIELKNINKQKDQEYEENENSTAFKKLKDTKIKIATDILNSIGGINQMSKRIIEINKERMIEIKEELGYIP